jgi:hypothetical protein
MPNLGGILSMNVYGEDIYKRLGGKLVTIRVKEQRRVGADFLLNLYISGPAVLLAHAVLKVEHKIEPNEFENK